VAEPAAQQYRISLEGVKLVRRAEGRQLSRAPAAIHGTKSGHFVPDHQPPSATAPEGTPQRLYTQCIKCSREQVLELARQRRGQ
jgi:hypothetical protein